MEAGGCCISDGCGEQGNLVHTHDFFYSGDIFLVSIEHGRASHNTGKKGRCLISRVIKSEGVKVWWLVWGCGASDLLF